ncbi:hypothetical protein [Citreimonas sp.]|uniref:hypothetical protein n=1 Tax=Citreimonas sp. TaxID=3036715 RepID=UPI00405A03D9
MKQVNATQLAKELGLSKARVSQLVSDGTLDGCYSGDGRARRFDLKVTAERLNRKLDPGQLMGNGAQTRERIRRIQAETAETGDGAEPEPRDGTLLNPKDPDRYELARTHKAEEEARKLRRQNAEAEGTYVLASEVQREVARQIGQEIAEVETMLRDAARRVADKLGVDYREVRQVLTETWRSHREGRSTALAETGAAAELNDAEKAEDI